MSVLPTIDRDWRRLRARVLGSDTGKAAALAVATLANNAIQLVFTIAVTRILGADGYGALAALISAFLILVVGGQAVQAAAAREAALGRLGEGSALLATVEAWTRTVGIAIVVCAGIGIAVRHPLASLVGVEEHPWAAAALLPTGGLWMLLSLQRGVLQGLHAFRPVALSIIGEAGSRLVLGLVLAATVGVTGAFLATPLCFVVMIAWLWGVLQRRLGALQHPHARVTLRRLMGDGRVPIVGLALLAVLQNVDIIIARHQLGHDRAGSYAVAAVAAKALVWVAIGVGLQLLPQATARAAAGEDPRPVLTRALGVVAVVAAPALIVFAAVPSLLLRVVFGPDTVDAASSLILLGVAMTLLATTYLTVQYLFALGHARFLWALGAVAVAEVAVLLSGSFSIKGFAGTVALVQLGAAAAMALVAVRARPLGAAAQRA